MTPRAPRAARTDVDPVTVANAGERQPEQRLMGGSLISAQLIRVDGVRRTLGCQPRGRGSIPASTLHYWFGNNDEAVQLVERFHYSKRWPSNVQQVMTAHEAGGLFGNRGRAVAAVVYSIPPTRWSEDVWELARLVRRDDVLCQLSAIVAASVRRLKRIDTPGLLVSFADWTQMHHGGIYQACGWSYHGKRAEAMDGVIIDGQFVPGRSANSAYGTRSPRRLKERGITAEAHWDAGKHLYWLALNPNGLAKAERIGLDSTSYPKPQGETDVAL